MKKENNSSRVIVNADDFGMNERNSVAIAEAFQKGFITDTTALANGAFLEKAIALAKEQGFWDKIGVHLNLTEGVPLTEGITRCPRFVSDGRFHKQYNRTKRLTVAEKAAIYKELTAQVNRLQSMGVNLTHADSHHHIHTGVFVAPIAVRVCRENGIQKIRLHRNLESVSTLKKLVKKSYNRWLSRQGFVTTRYFAYVMDIENGEIPDDTEIMVHPDYDKSGVLIDRRGKENGFPTGNPLPDFRIGRNLSLRGYADL